MALDRAGDARGADERPARRRRLLLLGVFGAALFYGDSVITPAISVLGAVEGLEVATPALKTWVVPISVGILIGLFVVQRHGTRPRRQRCSARSSLLWFAVLAATGDRGRSSQEPAILRRSIRATRSSFLRERGWHCLRGGRRDRPRPHRCRGALRRHGPLRQAADPARLDRHRPARARAQLHGPGRAPDARPRRAREPVLSPVPERVADARGGAGDAAPR